MTLAQLRRRFARAESDRLAALDIYRATLDYYRTRRSARTRIEAYQDVLVAYREAIRATRVRDRAAEAVERARLIRPAGTEFELTASTRGGSPRHDRRIVDPRILHLKIRVILERPMTQATAGALLAEAVRTRRVPSGIRIEGIDWAKGTSGKQQSDDPVSVQLRRFYGAIQQGQPRFAEVAS